MSKREKVLACIVASLVLVALVGFVGREVNDAFREKRQRLSQLESEIRDKKLFDQFTQEHRDRMEVYKARSLPSDLEEARSLYNEWLVNRAVEVGFVDQKITPVAPRISSKVYNALGFTITAKGNLEQMVRFLHTFYSVDYLHRISRLHVNRHRGTKELGLTFWVDALSLPTATNEELTDEPSNRLTHDDLDDCRKTIVYRNLFGLPNEEPKMKPVGTVTGYRGRTVEITVAGEDPNELDELRYSFQGDGFPDDCLDERSGRFRWYPEELGEFEVVFTATDDGWPPKSVSQTAKITVTDPPPEVKEPPRMPSFEKAKYAVVTGVTDDDGRKQAWIHLRTEDEMLQLGEGDEFDVGEVTVTVRRISEKTVELEAKVLQKRLSVGLGQSLAEGSVLPPDEG